MVCVNTKYCVLSNMRMCTPEFNHHILKINFHSVKFTVNLYRIVGKKIYFLFGYT